MSDKTVGELIRRIDAKTPMVSQDKVVADAIEQMLSLDEDHCLVTRETRIIGIVSARDILARAVMQGEDVKTMKVHRVMSTPVRFAKSETPILIAMEAMVEHSIRCLVCEEDGVLVGTLTFANLVASRADNLELEAEDLDRYITGRFIQTRRGRRCSQMTAMSSRSTGEYGSKEKEDASDEEDVVTSE